MHYMEILVEGLEIHKLLTQCLKERIALKNIKILSDYEFTAFIDADDWIHFCRITENRYLVSMVAEKGAKPFFFKLISNRLAVFGFILFIIIILLQASFIAEIRVYGYERIPEKRIYDTLEEAGLYVGSSRYIDLNKVKIELYRNLEDISWVGISIKGSLAEVTIAEGTRPIIEVDKDKPCHIVARKEGYIEKVIAREGKEAVEKDDFVHVGEILISGIIGIDDMIYEEDSENPQFRYVHSDGEVYAKTVYRFVCYQAKEVTEKELTGKNVMGIKIKIGTKVLNTPNLIKKYEKSEYKEKEVLGLVWPVPFQLAVTKVSELKLNSREKSEDEVIGHAERQARELIKNNIDESAQITNKGLKFLPEENIIKVTILVETIEEVGEKKAFTAESENSL